MTLIPLKNQIINWLKSYPYWFQYAGNLILDNKEISEVLIDKTYIYFKEDLGLKTSTEERLEIIFNEITIDNTGSDDQIKFVSIKNIKNVNALKPEQSISIGPNLTVIFGANGSGKSGYIRLLNNAFDSRGDKKILQNVFEPASTEPVIPSCTFGFSNGANEYDLNFPDDHTNSVFSQFSIFDTHSVRIHLENDNKLNFTPNGFEFFELLMQLYEALKTKLNAEIASNRPANAFSSTFVNDNEVQEIVANLSAGTDESAIKRLATVTDEEKAEYEVLIQNRAELQALNIPKKIEELQDLKNSFKIFIQKQQAILDFLQEDKIVEYTSLLNDYAKFTQLTKEEGITKFDKYEISEVGSKEWQTFIHAAKAYAILIDSNREANDYPIADDHCLLCLRPITETEQNLLKAYWDLLESAAGSELQRIDNEIIKTIVSLNSLDDVLFDEGSVLYNYLANLTSELAEKWKEISASSIALKKDIVSNLSGRETKLPMQSLVYGTDELNAIVTDIQTKIDELLVSDIATELATVKKKILLIEDRNVLSKMLATILSLVTSYKWASKAESAISTFNTIAITKKQGELFGLHVTQKYTDLFITECQRLKAPSVVTIVQKNSKSSSLRKLQINGFVASSVLSEGEQRVISLADFITETQLNPNNKGIIFDDPVTSQDHIRKEIIADRIAALAREKQVIVFTHDISFFIRLQLTAESIDADCKVTTMRNLNGMPGVIKPDLPWVAQKITDRIKYLTNDLVRLKAIEKSHDTDEYLMAAKAWYGLLREGWERGVEERLFKGVIERFGYGIQTQRLRKLDITTELLNEIETGMTNCSNWVHDSASGRNPEPPDTIQAEADLNALNAFAKKCLAA